jgi:membrane associated rhomboid family serine protease
VSVLISSVAQVVLASAAARGAIRRIAHWRVPLLTLAVLLILALCLALQLRDPGLLPLVERNATAIRHGEYLRLVTAMWFQDGGLSGALLNLAMLAVVGWIAEAELVRARWILGYAAGGLAGQVTGLIWAPIGAGNSVATLGLAGGLFARYLRDARGAGALLPAGALLLASVMVALRDIHGVAALAGAISGLAVPRRRPAGGS